MILGDDESTDIVYTRDGAIMRLSPASLIRSDCTPSDWDLLTVTQRRTVVTGSNTANHVSGRESDDSVRLHEGQRESTSKHGTGYFEMNVDETCSNERVWQENEGSETLSESEMRFGSSRPI